MLSLISNNDKIWNVLIENNINLNIQDVVGKTAIFYRVFKNNIDIFNKIINTKYNVNIYDINDQNIFHYI